MAGSAQPATPDRYVSFEGINCDQNAETLIDMIKVYADGPAAKNKFWRIFAKKIERSRAGDTGVGDALYLIHSNVYYIRDLFEEYEDETALELRDHIEEECG